MLTANRRTLTDNTDEKKRQSQYAAAEPVYQKERDDGGSGAQGAERHVTFRRHRLP